MMIGINNTIADNSRATSCVFATVETSKPNESAKRIYIAEMTNIHNKEPCNGTPSTKADIRSITVRITKVNTKYGISFATTIIKGLVGETRSTSIVPFSFSRTIEIDVIIAQTNISKVPMIAGTKL